jgi:hypothetical protein
VLDHHHLTGGAGSTASLVLTRPALVAAAVNPGRGPDDPFTVVLHEHPDFDAVASACLALHYLETGRFPFAAAALAHYADRIDAGYPGLSLAAPFSPYAAYRRLGDRLAGRHCPPRTGYDNADPWYDGRAHDYTIDDAPRAGTLLRAEEIETIFLHFGGRDGPADPLGG